MQLWGSLIAGVAQVGQVGHRGECHLNFVGYLLQRIQVGSGQLQIDAASAASAESAATAERMLSIRVDVATAWNGAPNRARLVHDLEHGAGTLLLRGDLDGVAGAAAAAATEEAETTATG